MTVLADHVLACLSSASADRESWTALRSLARKLARGDEDAAQSIVLAAIRYAPTFKGRTPGEAISWMRRVARSTIVDASRSRDAHLRVVRDLDDATLTGIIPPGDMMEDAARSVRERVLAMMGTPRRERSARAAWLRVMHGLTPAEINDVVHAPSLNAVEAMAYRGRKHIVAALDGAQLGEDVTAVLRLLFSRPRADKPGARYRRRAA